MCLNKSFIWNFCTSHIHQNEIFDVQQIHMNWSFHWNITFWVFIHIAGDCFYSLVPVRLLLQIIVFQLYLGGWRNQERDQLVIYAYLRYSFVSVILLKWLMNYVTLAVGPHVSLQGSTLHFTLYTSHGNPTENDWQDPTVSPIASGRFRHLLLSLVGWIEWMKCQRRAS